MRRALLLLAVAVAIPGLADTATATPICASARTYGTKTGNHSVGPYCHAYPYGGHCQTTGGGLEPKASAETTVCFPMP